MVKVLLRDCISHQVMDRATSVLEGEFLRKEVDNDGWANIEDIEVVYPGQKVTIEAGKNFRILCGNVAEVHLLAVNHHALTECTLYGPALYGDLKEDLQVVDESEITRNFEKHTDRAVGDICSEWSRGGRHIEMRLMSSFMAVIFATVAIFYAAFSLFDTPLAASLSALFVLVLLIRGLAFYLSGTILKSCKNAELSRLRSYAEGVHDIALDSNRYWTRRRSTYALRNWGISITRQGVNKTTDEKEGSCPAS